jgi:hypothetical protein
MPSGRPHNAPAVLSGLDEVSLPVSHAHQFSYYLSERLRETRCGASRARSCRRPGLWCIPASPLPRGSKTGPSLHVDHKDGVLREFEQGSLLGGRNLLLPPLRNVAENQHNANDFSFAGENWRGTVLDRNFTAIPCDQVHMVGHSQNLLLFEHTEHFIVRVMPDCFIDELEHIPDRLVQSLLRLPSG